MTKLFKHRLLSRRQALKMGLSGMTILAVLSLSKLKALSYLIYTLTDRRQVKNNEQRTFKVVGTKSLKQRAQAKGSIYGAFPHISPTDLERNLKLKSTFKRECGLVVAGFFWGQHRPTATTFDFTHSDYFAKFAATNQMLLRGHPLVWHLDLPKWVKETLTAQNARQIMITHIQTVVKRYAGKMHSWDVVNEGIEINDGRSDRLRNTPWLKFVGPDYIELAFRTAAAADPKALLVYNEWGLEYNEAHQDAVLKLLQRLKAKGTPIQALGIQSHLYSDREFKPQNFRKFLGNVAKLGLKIMITELDVLDTKLPLDIERRDRLVAGIYEDYLNVVLAEPAVTTVISWGLSDSHNWITETERRKDRGEPRPSVFDRQMRPKLAWNAIARAFDRSPVRP